MIRCKLNRLLLFHGPFTLVILYVFSTMALFWLGPLSWPMTNFLELALFQVFVVLAMTAGYLSTMTGKFRLVSSLSLRQFFRIGVFLTLAFQIPLTLTYTNKYPWDVIRAIMDQREAYEIMLEQVTGQQGVRFFIPLFRSIIMPFFYAALTYGVLNFKKLKNIDRVLLAVMILCPINFSLLRGTDKELYDLVVVLGGLSMVHFGRKYLANSGSARLPVRRLLFFTLAVTVAFVGLFLIFTYRKYQRMASLDEFCFAENLICADYSGPLLSVLPDFLSFGIAIFTFYLTNGYYGLSLALDQPWTFTYGIGHSSALLSLIERISNVPLLDFTFAGKVSEAGWDHQYYWMTIFPWLANDVGFFGSLIIIGFLARLFCQAWMDSVFSRNDGAVIVFILLCLLFFYLPANNQLTQTFDLYFAFIAALIIWKLLVKFRRST